MYVIHLCFICLPSDSTVSEDDGIEPRTVATLALTPDALISRLDLVHYFYSFYFNHLILCLHKKFLLFYYMQYMFFRSLYAVVVSGVTPRSCTWMGSIPRSWPPPAGPNPLRDPTPKRPGMSNKADISLLLPFLKMILVSCSHRVLIPPPFQTPQSLVESFEQVKYPSSAHWDRRAI
jgi:hypothetical protein